jgi:hypothetical protein
MSASPPPTSPATEPPAEGWRPRAAELVSTPLAALVLGAFVLYYGLCCLRVTWTGDLQAYCAAVSHLYRDFLHPAHDAFDEPGIPSAIYTPYIVLVAGAGRVLGVSPYRALQLAGIANLVLFVLGARSLMRRHSMHRWPWLATACFVLVTLFLRWQNFGWSSETSVVTLQWVPAYPSTLAWGLAFFALALVEDLRSPGRLPARAAGLAALLGFLLLIHLITASWVLGVLALRAGQLSFFREPSEGSRPLPRQSSDEQARLRSTRFADRRRSVARWWRPLAAVAAAAAGGFVLALLWPYTPFLGQSSLREVAERSDLGREPFADQLDLYLVAIPCAAWLVTRARRHLFFVVGFAATAAALLLWRAIGVGFGNRYAFFMAFFAQFLVAEVATAGLLVLLRSPPVGRSFWLDRVTPVALLLAAALAWIPSPMWKTKENTLPSPLALWRRPSTHDAYYAQFGALPAQVRRDDVVLMAGWQRAFDFLAITGAKVVSTRTLHRIPQTEARGQEMGLLFSEDARPEARLAIIRKYCATKVLLPSDRARVVAALQAWLGAPMYRDGQYTMFDVAPLGRQACPPPRSSS